MILADAAAESYPRIVAALIRVTGDWTLAEDCAQEAMRLALERWPEQGVPDNPGGWLMTVARNRAIDVLRRADVERRALRELATLALTEPADPEQEDVVDDRLRLIFTCCHPALSLEARVALTLRTICAVPTADIARAFLVTESTMTRRLTRAKTKIAAAGIPYRVPRGPALAERLPGVLAVLYLLFTQGYNAGMSLRMPGRGSWPTATRVGRGTRPARGAVRRPTTRSDPRPGANIPELENTAGEPAFADEAIRLGRLLARLMPAEPEVSALLALFLLQHARRDARRDAGGNLLTLDRQDRSRWDRAAIAEGVALLDRIPRAGPYALQALIAACHATAASAADTDWPRIAGCYDELARRQPSPVIELNRAVAHGYAYGPAAGLALLAEARAGGALEGYPHTVAAEADLTARLGDHARAAALFRDAAAVARSEAERRALLDRADQEATEESP